MPTRDDVQAAVSAAFAQGRRASVLRLVDAYGVEPYERERERVQLAVLKLAAGSEERLAYYMSVAKLDYRDVLLWADFPEAARADAPELLRRTLELMKESGPLPPPDDA